MAVVRDWTFVLVFGLASLGRIAAAWGECYDTNPPSCSEPCPCLDSCYYDEQCKAGEICVPDCLPSECWCEGEDGWAATADCAGRCIVPPVPDGPPTYTIVELPGSFFDAHANAINNLGQIVGEASFPGFSTRHACLWDGGDAVDLTPSADDYARANDINNQGQVLVSFRSRAYVWENGTLTELARFYPLGTTTAHSINDVGQIVGHATVRNVGERAALWEEGTITDVFSTIGLSTVNDINNVGNIAASEFDGFTIQPIIWRDGKVTHLGSLGGQFAATTEINNFDQVLGFSERAPGGDRVFYAFLWDKGKLIDLLAKTGHAGFPGSSRLNNCGDVLLSGDGPSRGTDFFLFNPGRELRPVRGVTRPASPWFRLYPKAVNDRGQIVGYGFIYGVGPSKAFLMSPIEGDLDGDGDIDLKDHAEFQQRYSGPLPPDLPGCERSDLDRDADIDIDDYELFRIELRGPM